MPFRPLILLLINSPSMQDVLSKPSRVGPGGAARLLVARARSEAPTLIDCGVALASAVLLIISFPDLEIWPLAWIGLVPLLLVVARSPRPWPSFLLGWLFGTVFFYGSCYWLTYSMIHTVGISPWVAFPLLLPGAVVVGVFPAIFAFVLARAIRRWGATALFLAPLFSTSASAGMSCSVPSILVKRPSTSSKCAASAVLISTPRARSASNATASRSG